MKHIRKYPAKLIKKFDVSPFDKNGLLKFIIFLSWIFTVLAYTSIEFIPEDCSCLNTNTKCYSSFTETLSPVELPPIDNIKFLRSEIGTVSSFNVILLPHEPSLIDRERGPPVYSF
jgi:hypothetical protein